MDVMGSRKRILCTNDDGFLAPGLAALGARGFETRRCDRRRTRPRTKRHKPFPDASPTDAGYISLTPLHLDLTNYQMVEEFEG